MQALSTFRFWLFIVVCVLVHSIPAVAEEKQKTAKLPETIVAKVGSESIYHFEVMQNLQALAKKRPGSKISNPKIYQAMLNQLIRQRLVHQRLEVLKKAADPYDVESEFLKIKAKFTGQGKDIEKDLSPPGIAAQVVKRNIAWKLSWDGYVATTLNEETLSTYFKTHRKEFDGTKVRARHILFSVPVSPLKNGKELEEARAKIIAAAKQVRKQITDGEISFEAAATKFSSAPSKKDGGDMGFFPRHNVMHKAIASATFQLKPNETSEPIISPFGIHLIQVVDEKPGELKLSDVKAAVHKAAAQSLFKKLAAEQRKKVVVFVP